MKQFTFILIFLSSFFSSRLDAQEMYVWRYQIDSNLNISRYDMYKYDFFKVNLEPLFSIDAQRFSDLNKAFYRDVIGSFEFSPDKRFVYFMQEEGALFRYEISTDSLVFLLDLTPETVPIIFVHFYTIINNIDFISDSILYASGFTFCAYNINTNTYIRYRQPTSHAIAFSSREKDILTRTLDRHKGQYIYISRDSVSKLMNLDLYNPDNNSMIHDFGLLFRSDNLLSIQFGCDSTNLYFLGTPDVNRLETAWYKLDPVTGFIQYSHPEPFPNSRIFRHKHYNSPEWEDCQRFVDLDKDDSTIGERDYLVKDLCHHTDISLSDIDIQISNEQPLDSIYIQVVDPLFSQQLNVPIGNYTLDQGPNFWNIIRNNGSSTNKDFENAIRSAVYTNWGPREGGEIRIGITPYHGGIAGKTAFAIYRIIDTIPNAGEDRLVSGCVSDSVLYLKSLVSPIDITDRFIWKGDSINLFDFYTPRNDTLLYIKQRGICYDTAVVNIFIHDVPTAVDLADTILCAGQKLDVDLTRIADDIVWNDGQPTKQKTFTSSGNYSYKVANSFGCVSQDSFALAYLPASESISIDTTLCIDGIFRYRDKEYIKAGSYSDKVVNSRGCDSIVTTINLFYHEEQSIIIEGDLGLCPGETTILTISSEHKNIMLGQTPSEKSIIIDSAGTYLISANDKYGCHSEKSFEITGYNAPVVLADDLVGIIFNNQISLPVQYFGNINSYNWTPSDGSLSCDDCPSPMLVRVAGNQYIIEVNDANGCRDRDTLLITYSSPEVFLPNVIGNKPNDLNNSRLYASGDVSGGTYDMSVYDRWGNLIYIEQGLEVNNRSQGWQPDGRFEQGVYVYKIRYMHNGEFVTVYGNVSLL